jgi:predicted metal-dependent phosphotriesterase family hydrolase
MICGLVWTIWIAFTLTGPISEHEAGTMLVHEHILVGFVEDRKLTPANYDIKGDDDMTYARPPC